MEMPEYFTELSIRMTEVLDAIGAEKDTVIERRKTYLWRECMLEITAKYEGKDWECFHFGSQSEGTTIPGLQSDIDLLMSLNTVNIMRIWEDWEPWMRNNLLMLKDDTKPAQLYLLQAIRGDIPKPLTRLRDDNHVRKDSGEVLFSSERRKQIIGYARGKGEEVFRNGPSVSNSPNWDNVDAFHVCKPLPEILQWIQRCQGRHWPPAQLLEAARVAPCFLVPAGHPDSDYKREEWRLSPNLIERMLMFSFNMQQIKCYIILKLIKNCLFNKIEGDCITSFHCKTIMFYTIEKTHPSLWFEHNLMFLLWLCLNELRKFLRFGNLPHYIIHGVNLFDGKISMVQQRRLFVYIDFMIRSNLQEIFNIDIDNIGCRLRARIIKRIANSGEKRRVCVRDSISYLLKFECVKHVLCRLCIINDQMHSSNTIVQQNIRCLLRMYLYCSTNVRLNTVCLEFIKHWYAAQTVMQLSNCLRLGNVIDSEIIRRFKYTLYTDVASSRLKLASILYCSGHIHAAVRVLEDVEMRFHSNVKAVCGIRRNEWESNRIVFNNMLSGNSDLEISEVPFAFCVKFSRQESYCTPDILLFEMKRNITEEEGAKRSNDDKIWMDSAEVDARPLLLYLQYLTYGAIGEREKQLDSWLAFESYICDGENNINLYHGETALNLFAHCYEIEGFYEMAFHYYRESVRYHGANNAANWHVRRVLRFIPFRHLVDFCSETM